jgi:dTDP-4-amino-4,6-dideoxygalactose transaminase
LTEKRQIQIRVGEFKIGAEERAIINEVLDSGRISEGPKTSEFEQQFSRYIGVSCSVAVNSGTSALIAGLEAIKLKYKIKKDTKVITSPLTYVATSNAIILTGLEPIYVDVDKETFVITPENIDAQLENTDTSDYGIILPVHLMGYPCDMDKINGIAKKHGFFVFEDSAQAHGTTYKGKHTGSLALIADFSFYIAHNIQAGELGAITTNDTELARLVKKIKANGRVCDCPICLRSTGKCPKLSSRSKDDMDPRFTHDLIGYNFKTMEFQTALALTQLKSAGQIKSKRTENVKYLNQELERFDDILQIPKFDEAISYMAYPIVIKKQSISRQKLRMKLEELGVETRPLFGCIPTQQPAYSYLSKKYKNKLPIADYLGKNGFYVGCHQYLTQQDLDYLVQSFKKTMQEITR